MCDAQTRYRSHIFRYFTLENDLETMLMLFKIGFYSKDPLLNQLSLKLSFVQTLL